MALRGQRWPFLGRSEVEIGRTDQANIETEPTAPENR